MPVIYRKTSKGLAELEDRTHGLTPRLRALLILVDGQRDTQALRTLWSQEVKPALDDLHRDGYIELLGTRRSRKPTTAFREPVTVVLPPAPMADVEVEELPGFVPLPEQGTGRVEGAPEQVDLLLDDLGGEPGAAVAAPQRLNAEVAPEVLATPAPAAPTEAPVPLAIAPGQPVEPAPADAPALQPVADTVPATAPVADAVPATAPVAPDAPAVPAAPAAPEPTVAPAARVAPAAPAAPGPSAAQGAPAASVARAPIAAPAAAASATPVALATPIAVAAPVAAATPVIAAAPAPTEPPRNPAFEARRRAAVRALHEEVGDDPDPQVHDLSLRMVRTRTPEALQPLLVEGAQLIARLRDRIAAEVYAMRFLA